MHVRNNSNYNRRKKAIERQRKIIIGLLVSLCAIILFLAVALWVRGSGQKTPSDETTLFSSTPSVPSSSDSNDPTVSPPTSEPLTLPTVSAQERAELLSALNQDFAHYFSSKSGRYSVFYINMENGEMASYRAAEPMVAASSVKIAYNTLLYKKYAEGSFSMDDKMAYNSAPYPTGDYESGTGTMQHSANGTPYTIREISRLSIRISDNCATNMVLRKLGGIDSVNSEFMIPISNVINYRSSVSYTDYSGATQSGRHRTSAEDLAKYAAELYRLYMLHPDVYEGLIEDLCNTEFSWGIPVGLSPGTRVAHKIGFNTAYATYNDVGIVFGAEDYVLCVMTESGNAEDAKACIAEVARMVETYLDKIYPDA